MLFLTRNVAIWKIVSFLMARFKGSLINSTFLLWIPGDKLNHWLGETVICDYWCSINLWEPLGLYKGQFCVPAAVEYQGLVINLSAIRYSGICPGLANYDKQWGIIGWHCGMQLEDAGGGGAVITLTRYIWLLQLGGICSSRQRCQLPSSPSILTWG